MDHALREEDEKRRQKLIKKLITFDLYKINNKHLFELTLYELEKEYKRVKSTAHPHSGLNSIHWVDED